jgi:hypothetical protein
MPVVNFNNQSEQSPSFKITTTNNAHNNSSNSAMEQSIQDEVKGWERIFDLDREV